MHVSIRQHKGAAMRVLASAHDYGGVYKMLFDGREMLTAALQAAHQEQQCSIAFVSILGKICLEMYSKFVKSPKFHQK